VIRFGMGASCPAVIFNFLFVPTFMTQPIGDVHGVGTRGLDHRLCWQRQQAHPMGLSMGGPLVTFKHSTRPQRIFASCELSPFDLSLFYFVSRDPGLYLKRQMKSSDDD
jgi:hypothetical protein